MQRQDEVLPPAFPPRRLQQLRKERRVVVLRQGIGKVGARELAPRRGKPRALGDGEQRIEDRPYHTQAPHVAVDEDPPPRPVVPDRARRRDVPPAPDGEEVADRQSGRERPAEDRKKLLPWRFAGIEILQLLERSPHGLRSAEGTERKRENPPARTVLRQAGPPRRQQLAPGWVVVEDCRERERVWIRPLDFGKEPESAEESESAARPREAAESAKIANPRRNAIKVAQRRRARSAPRDVPVAILHDDDFAVALQRLGNGISRGIVVPEPRPARHRRGSEPDEFRLV